MKALLGIILAGILLLSYGWTSNDESNKDIAFEEISFKSEDGLEMTADVYYTGDDENPWILLCHQARWSRGEYKEIAPKLVELGFNCLATDQRSGNEINDVKNETAARAREQGLGTEYIDAMPDIESAIEYIQNEKRPTKLILWGSSYSSTLAFVIAANHKDKVDGVMSFAPGDYFRINKKSIADYASKIDCPAFITSAKSEEPQWKGIYEAIQSDKSSYLPEDEGKHGASALWSSTKGHEGYWEAVKSFLAKF